MTIVSRAAQTWCWFALVLPASSILLPSVALAKSESTRLVVVLYPDDNDGRPGNLLFQRGLRSLLTSDPSTRLEIRSEFLDLSRNTDADYPRHLAAFLQQKYAGRRVDVVVTGLAPALDFALKYRDQIFPSVPIVFGAIDQREVTSRELPADVVGVPITMDLVATLELALRLHPHTQRVFVVAGRSDFDVHWEAEVRRAFRQHEGHLELVYLSGLPLRELTEKLSQLPEHSIVYYLHVFQDADGRAHIPADVLELLATNTNAPIYGHVDSYVGRGIVGGRVFSWEAEGQNAARLVLRIVSGEDPQQIGIQDVSSNANMFDWKQLQRWHISEASLPAGSMVRNQVPSLWELYKWHIVGLVSLCILQGLTIAGMVTQRSQRTRAEHRFRQAVNAAPIGMLMIGRDGSIVLVNSQIEKLFGYRRDELLGQTVELMVPERFRSAHPHHRESFFDSPQARPMGSGRELFGRRKDGSEFPVEIGLSPLRTEQGPFVLASVIDITESRRAEQGLLESQHELRVLNGRLLEAHEEERRRIARELHDDFNQTLALLAVQMDLLRQKSPASAEFAASMEDLSGRVKQLSSSIHDLSHQLHPFKLEQLGLVAAVQGLCLELTQNHKLEIAVIHDRVPERLSADCALCLYRIVQEAMRNIIKHSHAQHARVELEGRADAILLRILDDGCGFDSDTVDGRGGLGLVSIRERLRLVGGEVVIHSEHSRGTKIEVRVPWDAGG